MHSDARYNYYPRLENLGVSSGVYISSVESGSPADKAGMKVADVIIEADGEEINSLAYLRYRLYQHDVGDTMRIRVYRDGKEVDLEIELSVASKE